jgi:hypothetical protein
MFPRFGFFALLATLLVAPMVAEGEDGPVDPGLRTVGPLSRAEPNADGGLNRDGVHDDAPAINAAIASSCSEPYRTDIRLPAGVIAIASTIQIPCSNLRILGHGTGAPFHDTGRNEPEASTTLKWIGPKRGTMVAMRPLTRQSKPERRNAGNDFEGILLDGGSTAGTGLDLRSVSGSRIRVAFHDLTAVGVRVDTAPIGEFVDPQGNDFWIEGDNEHTTGIGVLCDGTARTGANQGNCSMNIFRHVFLRIKQGDGFMFGYSDHNSVDYLNVQAAEGATGRTLVFRASSETIPSSNLGYVAYNNWVRFVTGHTPIVAEGTETARYPSHDNAILNLDRSNSTPFPTVGKAASVKVWTDSGNLFQTNVGSGINTDTPKHEWDVHGAIAATYGYWLNETPIIDGSNNAGFATVTAANGGTFGGPLKLAAYTVASLNKTLPCNAGNAGKLVYVTDAASPAYNASLSGGGASTVPAFCDGSSWTAH